MTIWFGREPVWLSYEEGRALAKSGIKIKPENKGKLHKALGVAKGQKIPAAKVAAAKNSSDPALRKEATFAQNAKKWSHKGGRG